MRTTLPDSYCFPCAASCQQHNGCDMMQIYSLKLTSTSKTPPPPGGAGAGGGPIHLYGFMAVRDLLDPGRNYVFNRTREDPFTIQDPSQDPSIGLSGPKRGVYFMCAVLIEYDMRIIKHQAGAAAAGDDGGGGDLPLVDGVVYCSEMTRTQGPTTFRISGDGGAALDLSWALVPQAVEATVQVRIAQLPPPELAGGGGLDLSVSGVVPPRTGEIKLFRGVVDKPCALNRFVVAVGVASSMLLIFRDPAGNTGEFAFRAAPHGCVSERRSFGFATVEVKVTWSNLQ